MSKSKFKAEDVQQAMSLVLKRGKFKVREEKIPFGKKFTVVEADLEELVTQVLKRGDAIAQAVATNEERLAQALHMLHVWMERECGNPEESHSVEEVRHDHPDSGDFECMEEARELIRFMGMEREHGLWQSLSETDRKQACRRGRRRGRGA